MKIFTFILVEIIGYFNIALLLTHYGIHGIDIIMIMLAIGVVEGFINMTKKYIEDHTL